MSNTLKQDLKENLRQRLMAGCGIREIAKVTGVSRNAIRRLARTEGLVQSNLKKVDSAPDGAIPTIKSLDLRLLEKMYGGIREPGPAKDFELQIKSLAQELANELGVRSRIDATRLELAVSQYILYRRFFFASMDVSDKLYCGPYAKFHDKQAKAAVAWIEASNHALEAFSRLIRELEIKAGLRGPSAKQSGITLQQQVNVTVDQMRGPKVST
jgi:hypothetical protein